MAAASRAGAEAYDEWQPGQKLSFGTKTLSSGTKTSSIPSNRGQRKFPSSARILKAVFFVPAVISVPAHLLLIFHAKDIGLL